VHNDGHFIHAVAKAPVTIDELLEYEQAHAGDPLLQEPVYELLEVHADAFKNISMEDISTMLRRCPKPDHTHHPHRCAITLSAFDDHSWDLAKFYKTMLMQHSPETVVVFAASDIAKKWLGVNNTD
jgi:hypothetical protein